MILYHTGRLPPNGIIVVLTLININSRCLVVIRFIHVKATRFTYKDLPRHSPHCSCSAFLLYHPIWRESALPLAVYHQCCPLAASSLNPYYSCTVSGMISERRDCQRRNLRKGTTGVKVWVCKRFEFGIRSVNNLKTARHNIVNHSENGYGWDNYTGCYCLKH